MEKTVAIRPLTEVVGDAFAADIRKVVPSPIEPAGFLSPALIVIIGERREARRDAVLSLLQEYLGDMYRQRIVFISDHPEEIPAQPPKKDASMEEYTYGAAVFSVSPEGTKLPDEGILDAIRGGPGSPTTRLAKTIADFSRWDIDIYAVLSPLEMFSWQVIVQMTLTGSPSYATIERAPGTPVHIGEESIAALSMLGAANPEGGVTFIDLDQKKVFRTLADAQISA